MKVLAIDPGARHVGWAKFTPRGKVPVTTGEYDAEQALDIVTADFELCRKLNYKPTLIVEEYVLYPSKAKEQAWKPMLTSEMIGALKLLAGQYDFEVVEQGANVMNPTKRQLRARGIKPVSRGPHAKAAELHLMHFLLKRGMWKQNQNGGGAR